VLVFPSEPLFLTLQAATLSYFSVLPQSFNGEPASATSVLPQLSPIVLRSLVSLFHHSFLLVFIFRPTYAICWVLCSCCEQLLRYDYDYDYDYYTPSNVVPLFDCSLLVDLVRCVWINHRDMRCFIVSWFFTRPPPPPGDNESTA
jgi:hypothetical protein